MKVFLAGGTGFFGTYLCRALPGEGHTLTILARPGTDTDSFGNAVRIIKGDPTQEGDWQESLAEHDAVINLAGTSIFQRWTKKTKKQYWKVEYFQRGTSLMRSKRSSIERSVF